MTQSGIMILPPISLPYVNQITRIKTTESQLRLTNHRSLQRHNNYQSTQTVKINS